MHINRRAQTLIAVVLLTLGAASVAGPGGAPLATAATCSDWSATPSARQVYGIRGLAALSSGEA